VTCRPPGELRYTRIRPRTTSAASGSDPARYTVVPAGKSARSPSARSWLASSAGSSARKLCAMASSTSRSTTPMTLGRIELQQKKGRPRALGRVVSLGRVGAKGGPRWVGMGKTESGRGYPSRDGSCPMDAHPQPDQGSWPAPPHQGAPADEGHTPAADPPELR